MSAKKHVKKFIIDYIKNKPKSDEESIINLRQALIESNGGFEKYSIATQETDNAIEMESLTNSIVDYAFEIINPLKHNNIIK